MNNQEKKSSFENRRGNDDERLVCSFTTPKSRLRAGKGNGNSEQGILVARKNKKQKETQRKKPKNGKKQVENSKAEFEPVRNWQNGTTGKTVKRGQKLRT